MAPYAGQSRNMEHICIARNNSCTRVCVKLLVLYVLTTFVTCNMMYCEQQHFSGSLGRRWSLLFLPAVMPVWCVRLWCGLPLVSAALLCCLPVVSSPQLARLPASIRDVCDAVKVGREEGGRGKGGEEGGGRGKPGLCYTYELSRLYNLKVLVLAK